MSKKMRKLLENIKSKQTIIGSVILVIVLCISATAVMTNPIPIKADNNEGYETQDYETQASASDFNYSKSVTIDHNQIDSDLCAFPVLINITDDSNLFANCVNDSGYDIAFFDSTNTTQFAHEIEYWNWDDGNSSVDAYIWVNVSEISSSSDTIFYMYYGYDNTNQQDITGVWNTSVFAMVHHFNETSGTRYDSTSNNYDSDVENEDNYDDGFIGKCDRWIRSNNDYMQIPNPPTPENFTFSLMIKGINNGADSPTYRTIYMIDNDKDPNLIYSVSLDDFFGNLYSAPGIAKVRLEGVSQTNLENYWYYLSFRNNWSGEHRGMIVYNSSDGACIANNWSSQGNYTSGGGANMWIGAMDDEGVTREFDGLFDEIRIYIVSVSDAWLKAEKNTYINCTDGNFFTLGTQQKQGDISVYSIKGLHNNRITWAGTGGNTVYCNASGNYHEWLEINMSINSTDNITGIRIWVGDLNDTSAWINASNITLYVSSDNSSYASLGSFTDGGSNISINSSTWPGGAGTNPFLSEGLKDKNASIWCVFKLDIPSSSPTDYFYASASDAWKIYLGYYG